MKKVTAMLFSMAVGLNAVSMAAKAKASEEQETDVLLIGGGIMSATLGTYLRELEPEWSMTMVERSVSTEFVDMLDNSFLSAVARTSRAGSSQIHRRGVWMPRARRRQVSSSHLLPHSGSPGAARAPN